MKERPGEKRGEPPSETRGLVHSTEREAPRHKKREKKKKSLQASRSTD